MTRKVKNLVYKMLTENTGTHMCDSGGSNGRSWQRNQSKTLKDFNDEPECYLDVERYHGRLEVSPTISVFHYLSQNLELDALCDSFNRKKVSDWKSDEFYGVSEAGEAWLLEHFTAKEDSWNTYNWSANFSQTMQGRELKCNVTGDRYVLLQIHGGADVRGGYTDAKLFKLHKYCDYFLNESCSFDVLDWSSEFITHEGSSATDEDLELLAKTYNVLKDGDKAKVIGSINQ
jgi:hypothetical protein